MKKLWVAVGVLAVLLALGIVSTLVMESVHAALSDTLEEANALAESARAKWEKSSHMIAALADHEPLEELDGLFAELAVCQRQADQRCFAAVCVRSASLAQMLQESHTPYWWNLL